MVVDSCLAGGPVREVHDAVKKIVRINAEIATMLQEVAAGANEEFGVE